mgnify:FL=1
MPRRNHGNNKSGQELQKPEWLKISLIKDAKYSHIKKLTKMSNLHTVCEEANCPNIYECWNGGTATFMLLGDVCTRVCKFCYVKSGKPNGIVDSFEPENVAKTVNKLNFKYVVLTSVNRDDLDDGGASHFAQTVNEIHKINPKILVEVLIPDFANDLSSLSTIVNSKPTVVAHNIETTESLSPMIRDIRADYHKSLNVLKTIKKIEPKIYTKSSIMLGLGETENEVIRTMRDLRKVDVDIITLGQYLQPSSFHAQIKEYVHPKKFEKLKSIGLKMGFMYIAAGPLVRSSYKAGELFVTSIKREKRT